MKTPPVPPRSRTRSPKTAPKPPPESGGSRPAKEFSTAPWTGGGEGQKIVGYGPSGVGKTTLFSMMPGARFIGLDDGGRCIRNPLTDKPIEHVIGLECFNDVRDALHQTGLWPKGSSCVIDTLTMLETWAEPHIFNTIPHEKGGRVSSLEGYGYGKGYVHLYETMRLVFQDLDALVKRGVNIGLICQSMATRKANPGGTDFLQDGPKLSHTFMEKSSVRLYACEWADHVFRIGYNDFHVEASRGAAVGKAGGSMTRVVAVLPEPHYMAKSRTLKDQFVTFDEAGDNSIWQFVFPGEGE